MTILSILAFTLLFPQPKLDTQYEMTKQVKVGGDGGFDYVYADSASRKLYVARTGQTPRLEVFDLDTLAPVKSLNGIRAHGAVTDAKTHHGFSSSSPVQMWDSKSLELLSSIDVQGEPDGMLNDDFNHRTYVFSHEAPNVTVLDDESGKVLGTIDLGGAPEQAASDGKGHIYVDIEDKDSVAVIDAKSMKVEKTFGLNGRGGGNAGLALDARNHVLYVACREPEVMVMLDSRDGSYLATLPIGKGCDGVVLNPKTHECFSSQGDGTLTVIKQTGPRSFEVAQTVKTLVSAKTCTFDAKTGRILLIAAEFGPAPTPAQGQRRRRGALIPGSFSILVVSK